MDWLAYYDTVAEEIDDGILDEADEQFGIGISEGETLVIPDAYYIWVAQKHHELVTVV